MVLFVILNYYLFLLSTTPFIDGNLSVYGSEHYKNILSEVVDISSEVIPEIKNEPITVMITDLYDHRWLGMHIYYIGIIAINNPSTNNDLVFQKIFLHELFHQLGVGNHPEWFEYVKNHPHTPDLKHFDNTEDLMDQYYRPENRITNLTLNFMEHIGYEVRWNKRDGKLFSLI